MPYGQTADFYMPLKEKAGMAFLRNYKSQSNFLIQKFLIFVLYNTGRKI
jgi:hypothetical protein